MSQEMCACIQMINFSRFILEGEECIPVAGSGQALTHLSHQTPVTGAAR